MACNFIKKETLAQVFSRKFCEISKSTILTEHLWLTIDSFRNTFGDTSFLDIIL